MTRILSPTLYQLSLPSTPSTHGLYQWSLPVTPSTHGLYQLSLPFTPSTHGLYPCTFDKFCHLFLSTLYIYSFMFLTRTPQYCGLQSRGEWGWEVRGKTALRDYGAHGQEGRRCRTDCRRRFLTRPQDPSQMALQNLAQQFCRVHFGRNVKKKIPSVHFPQDEID